LNFVQWYLQGTEVFSIHLASNTGLHSLCIHSMAREDRKYAWDLQNMRKINYVGFGDSIESVGCDGQAP